MGNTIAGNGETDIIYLKDFGSGQIRYKINNDVYINLSTSLPITITNTNPTYTLKVLLENDLTFTDSNRYFICDSENIQFGSESLNIDGSRPTITIDNITNYLGFIQNGTSSLDGFNNIYIYNLKITTLNSSTMSSDAGWFGQSYFGKNAINNYIINCSSDGPIIDAGGGIIGGYASNNGNLKIIGCSSSGNTGQYSGGIVGFYAAQNGGEITCESCFSTGIINIDSGGIFGYISGNFGTTIAKNCYSIGNITSNTSGGIYGSSSGDNGNAYAENCYSLGNIDANCGGIYGYNAAPNGGICIARNCYSNGLITTLGNGIYGSSKNIGASEINCYASDGIWSKSIANTNLTGIPNVVVGETWVESIIDQPYELLNIGYTPYNINNILITPTPHLNRTYRISVKQCKSSNRGIISGLSYEILQKSGGNGININNFSGIISTTKSTKSGTYTLYIKNNGSYNITEYILIVKNSKKNKKNKMKFYFNNLQKTTTIIKSKNCNPCYIFNW
jgi:hypothetical protein